VNFKFPAILALFLNRKLGFNPDMSTALYHTYEFLIYFFTIIGAIIAESWLGLFKTITWMSLVYALGAGIISFGTIETIGVPVL
jgi:solute carrier family 15 (oligopeptide transporter), member 1